MRSLTVLFLLFSAAARADILILDEGVVLGPVIIIDCRGPTTPICTVSGGDGTITVN